MPHTTKPLALIFFLSLAGCMMPAGGAVGSTDKSIDRDGAASAGIALADCWITEGESSDPAYRQDQVTCALDPSAEALGFEILDFEFSTAGGSLGSGTRFGSERRATFSSYAEFRPYPLDLSLYLRARRSFADESEAEGSYDFSVRFDDPSTTHTFSIPAELWIVQLDGAGLESVRLARVDIPLTREVDGITINNGDEITLFTGPDDPAPTSVAFMVPAGVTAIDATYTPRNGEPMPFVIERDRTALVAYDDGTSEAF